MLLDLTTNNLIYSTVTVKYIESWSDRIDSYNQPILDLSPDNRYLKCWNFSCHVQNRDFGGLLYWADHIRDSDKSEKHSEWF